MSHLLLSPDAPIVLRAAAGLALGLHVGGASMGMASGAVAMVARKGGRLHRVSGTVFFVSMLTMSGVAAIVAPMLPDRFSALMGVFAFYLTLAAWVTVRRKPGTIGRFEAVAPFVALGVAAIALVLAWIGGRMPKGLLDGEPSQLGYVVAGLAVLAAVSDLRVLRAGGVSGPSRLARHLWRMCLALFIAWGSFAGQPMAQPAAVRNSPWLFVPALIVLGLMVFWLVRVRLSGPRRARRAVRASPLAPVQEVVT
jgi:uncharacterized membrane protein